MDKAADKVNHNIGTIVGDNTRERHILLLQNRIPGLWYKPRTCNVLPSFIMDYSVILYVLLCLGALVQGISGSQTGYCQVYSYNIKYRSSDVQEKHLFVCCNNGEEKQCEGATYQKPSRTEGKVT